MKTKIDTGALKAKHRLELVMAETGEEFRIDPKDPGHWLSVTTEGLAVDIHRQTYSLLGKEGDVFDWLKWRYGWNFSKAIKYLQWRSPDLDKQEATAKTENAHVKPVEIPTNGSLDKWQKKALKLGGDSVREFISMSWLQILESLSYYPARFMPIIAIDTDNCPECGEPFYWDDPKTRAYISEKDEFGGEDLPEELRNKYFLDVWVEGVICEKCMRKKVNFYQALNYCSASARMRDDKRWEWEREQKEEERKRIVLEDKEQFEADSEAWAAREKEQKKP